MRHLDLFSGIGGFALAARWMGWQTVQFVEIDSFCQKVLNKNFPNIPIHGDIKKFNGTEWAGKIDILTGGFPCQDISIAGKHEGITGSRSSLWSELFRVASEIRPRFIVVENVGALVARGMEKVLGDLSSIGYDAEWDAFYAYQVGFPHNRKRIFIIAYPQDDRLQHTEHGESPSAYQWRFLQKISASGNVTENQRRIYEQTRTAEFVRRPDGIPNRVDRIKSLGNAIVPQVAFEIFKAIEQTL